MNSYERDAMASTSGVDGMKAKARRVALNEGSLKRVYSGRARSGRNRRKRDPRREAMQA